MQVLSGNEQVVLNVGGVSFTTTQTTLQNAPVPSLFAAMFSGRHTLKADQVTHAGASYYAVDVQLPLLTGFLTFCTEWTLLSGQRWSAFSRHTQLPEGMCFASCSWIELKCTRPTGNISSWVRHVKQAGKHAL